MYECIYRISSKPNDYESILMTRISYSDLYRTMYMFLFRVHSLTLLLFLLLLTGAGAGAAAATIGALWLA